MAGGDAVAGGDGVAGGHVVTGESTLGDGPRVTGTRVTGPRVTGPRVTGARVTGARVAGATPAGAGPSRLRTFNPVYLGHLEAAVWVAYYRRQWARFLVLSVLVVRYAFGMDWVRTVHGAWLVLRANMVWAPPEPKSDPAAARRCMRRFYALLRLAHGEPADPARAARLEVEWWAVHRAHQRGDDGDAQPLVDALSRLYAYIFGGDEAALRPAAEHRAQAMDISDQWVVEGCQLDSPLLPAERAALVRSYAALLAVIHH